MILLNIIIVKVKIYIQMKYQIQYLKIMEVQNLLIRQNLEKSHVLKKPMGLYHLIKKVIKINI